MSLSSMYCLGSSKKQCLRGQGTLDGSDLLASRSGIVTGCTAVSMAKVDVEVSVGRSTKQLSTVDGHFETVTLWSYRLSR